MTNKLLRDSLICILDQSITISEIELNNGRYFLTLDFRIKDKEVTAGMPCIKKVKNHE